MMWNSDEEDDDVGIHFAPTDEELIKDYLIQVIGNKSLCGGEEYIVYKDVYAKEPWLLDHNNKDNFFEENEWYYFSTRTQVSELKIGCGKNTKRNITGGGNGYWKANNHVDIIDKKTGKPIGRKNNLTFKKSKNKKKKQKIGDDNNTTTTCVPGSDSSWTMEEYLLGGDTMTTFQELVICKIKEKKKKNSKMEVEDDASCGDANMAHQSNDQFEPEQIVEDDQLLNAPLSHDSYLHIQEEEEAFGRWIQDLELDLLMITSNDQALDYNSSANICV